MVLYYKDILFLRSCRLFRSLAFHYIVDVIANCVPVLLAVQHYSNHVSLIEVFVYYKTTPTPLFCLVIVIKRRMSRIICWKVTEPASH